MAGTLICVAMCSFAFASKMFQASLRVTQQIEISLQEIIQPLSCSVGAFMNGSSVGICISEYRIQKDLNPKLSGILIKTQTR